MTAENLLGRTGKLRCEDSVIPVKIIAVSETKKCPKCGGPWGTTETTELAMLNGKRMVLKGTTADGCLNDVLLDVVPPPMAITLMPVGTPTVNDRVYPVAVVEAMIRGAEDRISRRCLFCHALSQPHEEPTPATVIGIVDRLFIANGFLQADITFTKSVAPGVEFTISCVGYTTHEVPPKVYDAALSHLLTVPTDWTLRFPRVLSE